MCIELYVPHQHINLCFQHENIHFTSASSFIGDFTFLIENSSNSPIDELSVLCPRQLCKLSTDGELELAGVNDVTDELADSSEYFGPVRGNRLRVHLPDPERQFNELAFEGYFNPNNVKWFLPPQLASPHVRLLSSYGFSAWNARLQHPIAPKERHWFRWRLNVCDTGDALPQTLAGPLVFHQLVGPANVRTKLVELIENGYRTPNSFDDDAELLHSELIEVLALRSQRQVSSNFYELTVEPGDPNKRLVYNWSVEGNLSMRANSPRVGKHLLWDRSRLNEPIFEWRVGKGSYLSEADSPDAFQLNLTLQCVEGDDRPIKPDHDQQTQNEELGNVTRQTNHNQGSLDKTTANDSRPPLPPPGSPNDSSDNFPEDDERKEFLRLRQRILRAISELLEFQARPDGASLRDEIVQQANALVKHLKARLLKAPLENEKICAEIALLLAKRERELAEAENARAAAMKTWVEAERERLKLQKDRIVTALETYRLLASCFPDPAPEMQVDALIRALQ